MAEIADFYRASYGGLQLWLSRLSTDKSRTQVVHELSAGDDHVVQDRGRTLLRARASVQFDWMDGDDLSPIARVRQLSAAVDDKPRLFSHPIEGSFLARVGAFTYELDERSVLTAEVEFTQVAPIQPVTPAGAGGLTSAGEGAVSAAADTLTAELADVGMTSDLPAAAKAAASGWASADDLNPRDVLTQTGTLTASLGAAAADYENDLGLWSVLKATVELADATRAAAEAATADTAQTFALRVGAPVALRALLASIYSAEDADERYDAVMRLNDIATPGSLDPGTELQLPALTAAARGA